ncbi:unnamed protein product [Arctogadus glacialis]
MQPFPFSFETLLYFFVNVLETLKLHFFFSPESIALIFAHTRNSQLAVSQIRGATTPVPHTRKCNIQHQYNLQLSSSHELYRKGRDFATLFERTLVIRRKIPDTEPDSAP